MHEERIPPIRLRREFDSLGISTRADVPDVGSVCFGREARLHPVKRRVERAFLEPEACERAGDDLGYRLLRSLLKRDTCGCAGDERQSLQLDEGRAVVFTLD